MRNAVPSGMAGRGAALKAAVTPTDIAAPRSKSACKMCDTKCLPGMKTDLHHCMGAHDTKQK